MANLPHYAIASNLQSIAIGNTAHAYNANNIAIGIGYNQPYVYGGAVHTPERIIPHPIVPFTQPRVRKLAVWYLCGKIIPKDVCGLIAQRLQPSAQYMLARVFACRMHLTDDIIKCILVWNRPEFYTISKISSDISSDLIDKYDATPHDDVRVRLGVFPRGIRQLRASLHDNGMSTRDIASHAAAYGDVLLWDMVYDGQSINLRASKLPLSRVQSIPFDVQNLHIFLRQGGQVGMWAYDQARASKMTIHVNEILCVQLCTYVYNDNPALFDDYTPPTRDICEWYRGIMPPWPSRHTAQPNNYPVFIYMIEHGAVFTVQKMNVEYWKYLHMHGYVDARAHMGMIIDMYNDAAWCSEIWPDDIPISPDILRWRYRNEDTLENAIKLDSPIRLRKFGPHPRMIFEAIKACAFRCLRALRECNLTPEQRELVRDVMSKHTNSTIREDAKWF